MWEITQDVPDVDKIVQLLYIKYSKQKADIIVDNLVSKGIVGLELLYQYKKHNFNIEKMLKSLNI